MGLRCPDQASRHLRAADAKRLTARQTSRFSVERERYLTNPVECKRQSAGTLGTAFYSDLRLSPEPTPRLNRALGKALQCCPRTDGFEAPPPCSSANRRILSIHIVVWRSLEPRPWPKDR